MLEGFFKGTTEFAEKAVGIYGEYQEARNAGRVEQTLPVTTSAVNETGEDMGPLIFGFPQRNVLWFFGGLLVLGVVVQQAKG